MQRQCIWYTDFIFQVPPVLRQAFLLGHIFSYPLYYWGFAPRLIKLWILDYCWVSGVYCRFRKYSISNKQLKEKKCFLMDFLCLTVQKLLICNRVQTHLSFLCSRNNSIYGPFYSITPTVSSPFFVSESVLRSAYSLKGFLDMFSSFWWHSLHITPIKLWSVAFRHIKTLIIPPTLNLAHTTSCTLL